MLTDDIIKYSWSPVGSVLSLPVVIAIAFWKQASGRRSVLYLFPTAKLIWRHFINITKSRILNTLSLTKKLFLTIKLTLKPTLIPKNHTNPNPKRTNKVFDRPEWSQLQSEKHFRVVSWINYISFKLGFKLHCALFLANTRWQVW